MQTRTSLPSIDLDEDAKGGKAVQQVFLDAICQHRSLLGDMSATLRRLGSAIADSNLDAREKSILVAGIDQHVDSARNIVSNIDRALSIATMNSCTVRH